MIHFPKRIKRTPASTYSIADSLVNDDLSHSFSVGIVAYLKSLSWKSGLEYVRFHQGKFNFDDFKLAMEWELIVHDIRKVNEVRPVRESPRESPEERKEDLRRLCGAEKVILHKITNRDLHDYIEENMEEKGYPSR